MARSRHDRSGHRSLAFRPKCEPLESSARLGKPGSRSRARSCHRRLACGGVSASAATHHRRSQPGAGLVMRVRVRRHCLQSRRFFSKQSLATASTPLACMCRSILRCPFRARIWLRSCGSAGRHDDVAAHGGFAHPALGQRDSLSHLGGACSSPRVPTPSLSGQRRSQLHPGADA